MPLLYKLYKDTRKKKGTEDPANPKTYGKIYAKAVSIGTIESQELAEQVAYSASATVADTLAVINALVTVMAKNLKNGYVVKLDGFGSWRIGIKTTPALEASAFSVTNNIAGARVNFRPEYTVDTASHKQKVKMLDGVKIHETAKNEA